MIVYERGVCVQARRGVERDEVHEGCRVSSNVSTAANAMGFH